jgi:hypothetical protein
MQTKAGVWVKHCGETEIPESAQLELSLPVSAENPLLKPSGSLVIRVPAFNLVWANHDVVNQHLTDAVSQRHAVPAHEANRLKN